MYMTVSEFRKDLKKHFDSALRGDEVVIERGGISYKLRAEVVGFETRKSPTTLGRVGEGTISTEAQLKEFIPQIVGVTKGVKLCKEGHIADEWGKCQTKGCKYSR